MGAYREQLLRETYGRDTSRLLGQPEEEPSGFFTAFKLRFTISLLLFAGFVYLSLTGRSLCNVTAEQIVKVVTDGDLYIQLAEFLAVFLAVF